jgi:hypothetical protein
MDNDKRTQLVTQDTILKLLSDEETARVSTAETALRLNEGDEYLDLTQLDQGVRNADGVNAPMGRVLPRKAVLAATWDRILADLLIFKSTAR